MEAIIQGSRRPLWTVDDAAEYLNFSRKHIYRLVESGKLPHLKIGRRIRFRFQEIEAFLDRSSIEGDRS